MVRFAGHVVNDVDFPVAASTRLLSGGNVLWVVSSLDSDAALTLGDRAGRQRGTRGPTRSGCHLAWGAHLRTPGGGRGRVPCAPGFGVKGPLPGQGPLEEPPRARAVTCGTDSSTPLGHNSRTAPHSLRKPATTLDDD